MTTRYDLTIIGAGALGLSTAHEVARRHPELRVALLDAGLPGRASEAAGAMLAPFSEVTASSRRRDPERVGMVREATERWRSWLEAAEAEDGVRLISGRGTFLIRNTVSGPVEDDNFAAIVQTLQEHDAPFERVAPRDVPGLRTAPHERAVECIRIAEELCVDTARLLPYLERTLPATVERRRAHVESIEHDERSVTGVRTRDGERVATERVLICGGIWARALVPEAAGRDRIPPLLPGAGVAVLAGQPSEPITSTIRTPNRAFACGLHVLPTSDRAVYIGATNTPFPPGGGWILPTLSDVEFLVNCATRQVNTELARSPLLQTRTGNRPISIDLLPIMGATELPGLWLVTGTYRDGLTMAPVLAELLVDAIGDGRDRIPEAFRPCRPPSVGMDLASAVTEAVAHYVATGAEHETRLHAAGWSELVEALVARRIDGYQRSLPANTMVPPDLCGILDDDRDAAILRRLVEQHVAAWT